MRRARALRRRAVAHHGAARGARDVGSPSSTSSSPTSPTKREEIYEAFGARKQTLLDERQRRVQNIVARRPSASSRASSAGASTLKSADELNAYFASDAMVMKLRELPDQLASSATAVQGRRDPRRASRPLAAGRAAACATSWTSSRTGATIIKLGKHRFTVNTQPLELTMVPRDGEDGMALHLGGTDFYETVDGRGVQATRDYWRRTWCPRPTTSIAASTWPRAFCSDAGGQRRDAKSLRAARAAIAGGTLARTSCASTPRTATTRATTAVCTTRTPRSSWRSCCGIRQLPVCCASRRAAAPRQFCSGRHGDDA